MILLSHPTGNPNVRQALQAFEEAQSLAVFATTLAFSAKGTAWDILPRRIRRSLSRRAYNLPAARMYRHPGAEIRRLLRLWGAPDIFQIYQNLDQSTARWLHQNGKGMELSAVYTYEDGGLETLKAARDLGLERFYELPIGYWRVAREIYKEEAERRPEWASTLTGLKDSEEKLNRKDEEIGMAKTILVASSFTANSLASAPCDATSIAVIPYGMDLLPAAESAQGSSRLSTATGPLRVLYIGALTQRKGISYLFEAIDEIRGQVELTIIGRRVADCPALEDHLRKHRTITSLPHAEVLREIENHDILVLPSLFEGFGLVITEALSRGVPVIATDHTAAPDLFRDGTAGWIVPIRDANAIARRLSELASNPDLLRAMSEEARKCARRHSWESYRQKLLHKISGTHTQEDAPPFQ